MQLSDKTRSLIYLHGAVILFGFTAILGNLINLSALMLVWWRVVITCISLFFILKWRKVQFKFTRETNFTLIGIGFIVGLHWLCFYGSVKLANASVSLICMATTSFFTSFLEPIIMKGKVQKIEMIIGIAIVPMMALIVSDLNAAYIWGVVVGLLSAFLAALFNIFNKKHLDKASPLAMTFMELIGVFILMSIIIPFYQLSSGSFDFLPKDGMSWVYLLVLALLCTSFAWVISLLALKHLSAFESTLVVNLEPVYGIVFAAVLLKEYEQLNMSFYIGAVLILCSVILYPMLKNKLVNPTFDEVALK